MNDVSANYLKLFTGGFRPLFHFQEAAIRSQAVVMATISGIALFPNCHNYDSNL
jgi:hypothetical protein